MATGELLKMGAIPITNGSIDLTKTPVLIVDIVDAAITGNAHFSVVLSSNSAQQKIFYSDRNNTQIFVILGYATISNGTLTFSGFKRGQFNTAAMTDCTAPTINAIYGIRTN